MTPERRRAGDASRPADAGHPPEPPDRIEIWARRTGRLLGYVALLVLAVYLLFAYGPPLIRGE